MKKLLLCSLLLSVGLTLSACQKKNVLLAQNSQTPIESSPAPIQGFASPSATHSDVQLSSPNKNDVVYSPLMVAGKAPGSWFFEGQIQATLKDEAGKTLAHGPLLAKGDWMTTDLVEFSGNLVFAKPLQMTKAVLIIENDNPSGLPENGKSTSFSVEVR